ncbi:MAG: DNA polymerase III subunit alpha [Anaerolineae bacterium]|jgi:DNA-directed DNA polymerase III PolC|nr:DNA polymerase III subunit alpha [Anaerolineae bacterium]
MMPFTHLHVHSRYTLLGATPSVEDLAARAATEGLTHLALTDTLSLYGAVAFARACREVQVQPITGMVVPLAWPPDLMTLPGSETPGMLVLLATGSEGYRSLCRISSLAQGNADREAFLQHGVSLADLRGATAGLIALSGGRRGWVERCIRADAEPAAHRIAARLAGLFEDNFHLSLELHGSADDAVARQVTRLATRLGVSTVAVQPVYSLVPADKPRLRLLAAIRCNCNLDAVSADALPDGGDPSVAVHWLSPRQLAQRFAAFPEALERAGVLTEACAPALPTGERIWPAVDLPPKVTPELALGEAARAGLITRFGLPSPELASTRLEHEIEVICRHGYAPLFLVVADIVRYAREQEIPVSTRGSVANSLVAYCLGITTVDPMAHDLLFERFLSPARRDPPDIDLDFCSRRRDEVLDYVRHTYGAEHVALVGALNTLQLRSAAREVIKAHGLDESVLKRLLAALPRHSHRRWMQDQRPAEEIVAAIEDPHLREVARDAYSITGFPDHLSVHAGGIVVTPGPLTDYLPLQWSPKGFLVTQFDHTDVEAVGVAKMDLLGVRALTVLADAVELVRRDCDPAFRLVEIPLDDPTTAAMLARGDTIGVFQCDSEGARRTLCKLRAKTIADLAIANAFFKPGPATGGMADAFVRRYRGQERVTYLHPALASILGPTKGVLIFQEQILRVATEIAGLSWAQADHLRRGMSKMNPEAMVQMAAEFEAGCQRRPPEGPGLTAEQARRLWQQVEVFAGYGFNQGHATAYADVSYRSAYLKAHWAPAFFCARLQDWGGYHHPAVYMAEAVRWGIAVRPPHLNVSARRPVLLWEGLQPVIWLGLHLISDLRERALTALLAARKVAPFANLRDLLSRVPLQELEIVHLIQAGALDGLGPHRAALLEELSRIRRAGSARQLPLLVMESTALPETVMQRLVWERSVMGYPLATLQELLPQLRTTYAGTLPLTELPERQRVRVIGVRLPGWSRGPDFFLWDGVTWLLAKLAPRQALPPAWEPLLITGMRQTDGWGMTWLQVETASVCPC